MTEASQATVPTPLLWFAFGASLLWTVLSIHQLISRARAKLSVRLTREVFVRVGDYGDTLFVNPVYLSLNGPVLVDDVAIILRKTDGAQKSYPMEIRFVGEKARGQGPLADHYFYSTSPLTFIPESIPTRNVYMCVHKDYSNRYEKLINEFRVWLVTFKNNLPTNLETMSEDDRINAIQQVSLQVEQILMQAMQILQIEDGIYRLEINLRYHQEVIGITFTREARSAIEFKIGPGFRELIGGQLRQTFNRLALATVGSGMESVTYPEYAPQDVQELAS